MRRSPSLARKLRRCHWLPQKRRRLPQRLQKTTWWKTSPSRGEEESLDEDEYEETTETAFGADDPEPDAPSGWEPEDDDHRD